MLTAEKVNPYFLTSTNPESNIEIIAFFQIYLESRYHRFWNQLKADLLHENTYTKIGAAVLVELTSRNVKWSWKPKLEGSVVLTGLLSSGYADLVFCLPSTMSVNAKRMEVS